MVGYLFQKSKFEHATNIWAFNQIFGYSTKIYGHSTKIYGHSTKNLAAQPKYLGIRQKIEHATILISIFRNSENCGAIR